MSLTDRFLWAKHWQIFLLLFGAPFLFQMVFMGAMIAGMGNGQPDPLALIGPFFIFFPLLMIIVGATFFGWFWSIGISLQEKIPASARMKTGMFKLCFFFPLIYISLFVMGITVLMASLPTTIGNDVQPSPAFIVSSMAIIFPLHFFAMFCMIYCLYFVAKTFKTAQLQRETKFSDFAGEFFLFWFYPVGIWIVQPKINRIVNNDPGASIDFPT